jgi:hypothetical protein
VADEVRVSRPGPVRPPLPHVEVGVLLDRACPLSGPHDEDPARQWTEISWLSA